MEEENSKRIESNTELDDAFYKDLFMEQQEQM